MFKNAKNMYFPMLWFTQRALLTEDLASQLELLLVVKNIGAYTSYGFIGIGALISLIGVLILLLPNWRQNEGEPLIKS